MGLELLCLELREFSDDVVNGNTLSIEYVQFIARKYMNTGKTEMYTGGEHRFRLV